MEVKIILLTGFIGTMFPVQLFIGDCGDNHCDGVDAEVSKAVKIFFVIWVNRSFNSLSVKLYLAPKTASSFSPVGHEPF